MNSHHNFMRPTLCPLSILSYILMMMAWICLTDIINTLNGFISGKHSTEMTDARPAQKHIKIFARAARPCPENMRSVASVMYQMCHHFK